MSKKTNKKVLIIGSIIILAAFSLFFLLKGHAGATATISSNSYITGLYNAVPTYGYIQCKEGQDTAYYPALNDYTKFSYVNLRCQSFGTLLQNCNVNFKMPSASEVAKQASALTYRVCDNTDTACAFSGTGTVTTRARWLYINDNGVLNSIIPVSLSSNHFISAQYNEADILSLIFSRDTAVNKGRYQVSAKPFFLYRYDIFSLQQGQPVPGTEDCTNAKNLGEANLLITGVSGGGKLSQQINVSPTLTIDTAMRARGATFYYLSNFVATVPQYDMFPDGTKYCVDKKVYAVETITTAGGTYRVANTATNAELYSVECCNAGDVGAGYYCKDFRRVAISGSGGQTCDALNRCPIVGYQPVAGKQVVYQECSPTTHTCSIPLYKSVKCNNAFDCNGGYCVVDSLNPENNYCKTIQPVDSCDNGACEYSRGETLATCPKDCGDVSKNNFIWWIVAGVILLLIIILIIVLSRKGGNATTF